MLKVICALDAAAMQDETVEEKKSGRSLKPCLSLL